MTSALTLEPTFSVQMDVMFLELTFSVLTVEILLVWKFGSVMVANLLTLILNKKASMLLVPDENSLSLILNKKASMLLVPDENSLLLILNKKAVKFGRVKKNLVVL